MPEKILHITAPHFCAGAVFDTLTRRCIDSAPILAYLKGRSPEWVIGYCKFKGWSYQWEKVNEQVLDGQG